MATLKQYFDTDFTHLLSAHQPFIFDSKTETVEVICRIHYDFDADTIFVSYYVQPCKDLVPLAIELIKDLNWAVKMAHDTPVQFGKPGKEPILSTDLKFSARVHLYCEVDLSIQELATLNEQAKQFGRLVNFRGPNYAIARSEVERPLAFISHDTRDKDEIARPLAVELIQRSCPVWYDEYSLKVGSGLRQSIETGLKECKKCILVLSPRFLSNTGWTKTEFNSIFTREILERENVILPIWHGVTARDVYEYSPSLADRVAIEWSKGIDQVSRQIYDAIST